jgi:excisionase family DNA binding protein
MHHQECKQHSSALNPTKLHKLLKSDQVADYYGIDPRTLRRWVRNGEISFIRLPGKRASYRFRQSVVEAFLAARTVNTGVSDET